MSDIENQEKRPADAEAETATTIDVGVTMESPAEHEDTPVVPVTGRSTGRTLALLALVVAVAGLGAGYYFWQQLNTARQGSDSLLQEMKGGQSELQTQVSTLGEDLKKNTELAAGTAGALEELQRQTGDIQARLSRQAAGNEAEWMAAEVEYLMRIANRRLQLEQDVGTAIVALQMADKRLAENGDPLWVVVREQLAGELSALRSVPRTDLDGLSLRISSMITQVDAIQPLMGTAPSADEGKQDSDATVERTWESILQDGWQGFKSLVEIRYHDGELPRLLPQDQLYFLKQNLQLQLEAARLALLRRDQQLYTDSLDRAADWLTRYFDPEQEAVKLLLTEIGRLKGEEIRPQLPDISGSLRMLRTQIKRREETEQP